MAKRRRETPRTATTTPSRCEPACGAKMVTVVGPSGWGKSSLMDWKVCSKRPLEPNPIGIKEVAPSQGGAYLDALHNCANHVAPLGNVQV